MSTTERDELAKELAAAYGESPSSADADAADYILAAGYRQVFDGDCGLSGVKDPSDREASEAWMRWANLAMNEDIGSIGAMKQMLTEFGYRKPRTITTAEELDALPVGSVLIDRDHDICQRFRGGWRATIHEPNDDPWLTDTLEVDLPATVLREASK